MGVNKERLVVALDQVGPDDGADFERFAGAFLADEFPQLRAIGGMHDGGRDGIVYQAADVDDVVLQTSVTRDWVKKIRGTIETLSGNGIAVRELVYCTPLDVQRAADDIKRELRTQRIALDIRDRNYFIASADTSRGRAEAAERLSAQFATPLLAERTLVDPVQVVLRDEEATTAAAYLEAALTIKEPEKALTKFSFEVLVTYALRAATAEAPMARKELTLAVTRLLDAHDVTRVVGLMNTAITRLVKRNLIKHHTKDDAFVLAHEEREKMSAAIERAASERIALKRETAVRAKRVCADLAVDYLVDYELVAEDAIALAFKFLFERGRAAAEAVVRDGRYRTPEGSPVAFVQAAIAAHPNDLRSFPQMTAKSLLDVIPALVNDVLTRPDSVVESQLRRAADAYFLLFTLRSTPDVQKALDKLFGRASLLVDASIVVPCLAEALLPIEQRRMTRLLRAAKETGLSLVVTADVLNEVRTHLERLRVNYPSRVVARVSRFGAEHVAMFEPLIISVFLKTRAGESFDRFVEQFMGNVNPDQDLVEWLEEELGVQYQDFGDRFRDLSQEDVGTLHADWSNRKTRRPGVAPESFDTLVHHDVRAYLFVERERHRELGDRSRYSMRWWWLTLDGVAFAMDDRRRRGVGVCMSPDFFASFLSTQPRATRSDHGTLLPASLEMSRLGIVPPEVRDQAMAILEGHRGEPEYLLRRRLRDLANEAMAKRGDMAERGADSLAAEIDEETATQPAHTMAPGTVSTADPTTTGGGPT